MEPREAAEQTVQFVLMRVAAEQTVWAKTQPGRLLPCCSITADGVRPYGDVLHGEWARIL